MRNVKKQDLPAKVCAVCRRPFTWRRKWERVWAEVKYCSERCRTRAKRGKHDATTNTSGEAGGG